MLARKIPGCSQAGRLARFSVVGALNTLIDMAVFLVLVWWFGVPVVPANLLAFAVALANSYVMNRSWTFRDSGTAVSSGNVAKFVVLSCIGASIATAALWMLKEFGLPTLMAKLLSVAVAMGWNYLTMHHFVFAKAR